MAVAVQPTHLALDSQRRLLIQWSDGSRRVYKASQLREACPCATCRTGGSPAIWSAASAHRPTVEIREMVPVGNYAYKITFSDGHSTGIYVLDLLRRLGTEER